MCIRDRYYNEVNALLYPLQRRRRRRRRRLSGDVLASLGNGVKNIVSSASEFIFGSNVDDADEITSNDVGTNPSIRTLQDDVNVLKQSLAMEHRKNQKEVKSLKQNLEMEHRRTKMKQHENQKEVKVLKQNLEMKQRENLSLIHI